MQRRSKSPSRGAPTINDALSEHLKPKIEPEPQAWPWMSSTTTAPVPPWVPWALAAVVAAIALWSATLKAVVMAGVMDMGAFPLIDCFHAFAVAYEFETDADHNQAVLQRLFAVVLTSVGGTTIMSFLLGQPCGWLTDNQTIVPYLLMPLLMSYLPGRPVYRVIAASPTLQVVVGVLDDVSWGVAITKWGMFKSLRAAHESPRGSTVAALIAGTVAGCGGGLLQQAYSLNSVAWAFRTPASLQAPLLSMGGFGVKASFVGCVISYTLLDYHGIVPNWVSTPSRQPDVIYFAIVFMVCVATIRSTLQNVLVK